MPYRAADAVESQSPMPSISLRDATAADVPVITATIRAAFEEYRGVLNPPSGSHNESEEAVAQKLAKGGGLLAYVDDTLAGVVLYYPEADGSVYLGRLAVLPEYRQCGVGRALVNEVETRTKQAGYSRLRLGVRVQLPRNRAFFEKLGFHIISYESHPGHTEPTFVVMAKNV